MAIKLNNDELDTLRGLRYELFVLYVRLRERMDYASGFVGQRFGCGISWQGLREDLYVEPMRGVSTCTPSREAVRRMSVTLEREGLLVNRSRGKRLIFECVLADTDKSVQIKADSETTYLADTETTHQADTQADISQPSGSEGLRGYPDIESDIPKTPKGDIPKTPKADTHPVSGKINNSTPRENSNSSKSPIDDSFQVSEALNMFVRLKLQPDPPDVELNRLLFIEHFSELIDETTKKIFVTNESGKEKLFRKWLLRAKIIQQRDEQNRKVSSNTKATESGRRLSAFEEIENANSEARESVASTIIEGVHICE